MVVEVCGIIEIGFTLQLEFGYKSFIMGLLFDASNILATFISENQILERVQAAKPHVIQRFHPLWCPIFTLGQIYTLNIII